MAVKVERLIGWWIACALSVAGLRAAGDLRLVEAAKNQDRDALRALLKQKADVNQPQGDGATALHWAAHWNDAEIADLLIRAGANVNATNQLAVTPLHLACANRNAAIVEKLLAAGANPNAAISTGETALMTCARTGSVDAVDALLTHGANVNAKEELRGQTPLMWAIAEQHVDVVRVLIEHGADVHARSRSHKVLMDRGGGTGYYGKSSSEEPVERGENTPLLFAARQGSVECAELLVNAGADVNETAPEGVSVLVVAAHSGHRKLVAFLLEKGADINADKAGYTALHAATLRGDLDMVKLLLAHGANPNVQLARGTPVTRDTQDFLLPATLTGATPFFLAAKFVEVDIMGALAAAGADPRTPIRTGVTPLMAAAGFGWGSKADRRGRAVIDGMVPHEDENTLHAIEVAIDLGVDINAANQNGDTALHAAASQGFTRVVHLLADRGAKLDLKNTRGQTPLAVATSRSKTRDYFPSGLKETAELLRKLGANE